MVGRFPRGYYGCGGAMDISRGRWAWWVAAALLLVMVSEIALSTRQTSVSWDEGDHIYSGYMNWKHGEYS
jgi:hypothetical protein